MWGIDFKFKIKGYINGNLLFLFTLNYIQQTNTIMYLSDAELLARRLMREHDIPYWDFQWNNRKRGAGLCMHTKETIQLSRVVIAQMSEDETKDVILHEIAHAIVGTGHGHGSVWQRKAIEIGCNGQRCYDGSKIMVEHKYLGECPTCGDEFPRHRRPKKDSWCTECHKTNYIKYDPINAIVWRQVA